MTIYSIYLKSNDDIRHLLEIDDDIHHLLEIEWRYNLHYTWRQNAHQNFMHE